MNTLRFEEVDIHYVNDEGKLWFCGRDVWIALEYSKINPNVGKVLSKVSSTNKKSLSELVPNTPHNDGLAVYIDEFGLLKFVLTSKKQKARDFERFLEMAINNLKYTALNSLQSELQSLKSTHSSQLALTEKSHEETIKKLQKEHSTQLAIQEKKHKYQTDEAIATVLEESVASKRKRIRNIISENHELNEQLCRARRIGCEKCRINEKIAREYMMDAQYYRAQVDHIYELIDEGLDSSSIKQIVSKTRYC